MLTRPSNIQASLDVHAALLFLSLALLHQPDRLARQLLPEHALHDLFLPRLAVAEPDQQAGRYVAGDREAENDGGQGERADVVADAPCARTEGNLEEGMAVKQQDDSEQQVQRKCMVRNRLVWFVKGVRVGEFGLVMRESGLLLGVQH